MKQIFLISGYAQSGKDSTANLLKHFLIELASKKVLILHYADYLKFIATEYMGWDGQKDIPGRTLLQTLGTDKVRVEMRQPLFWVEKVCDIIKILYNDFDYFIVPDCRYKNEIHYPLALFPDRITTIRIEREFYNNNLTTEQKNHISETELSNYPHDYYIYSISGLDNLKIAVYNFIKLYNRRNKIDTNIW
jgi:hypothetical protein